MPSFDPNIVNVPACALRQKHGSEVINNRDKYKAIEVGDFAFLWLPASYQPQEVQHLIITSHGGAIEYPVSEVFEPYENLDEFKISKEGYVAAHFELPLDTNVFFYCDHGHEVNDFGLRRLYIEKSRAIPVDTYRGGENCPDYKLSKFNNSIYTKDNDVKESYSSIQSLMNFRKNECEKELDKSREHLKALIEEKKPVMADYLLKMEKQLDRINEYRKEAAALIKTKSHRGGSDPILEEKIGELFSKESALVDSYNVLADQYDDHKQLIQESESRVKYLTKELNEPCGVLTVRRRSHYKTENNDITLSRVLYELWDMNIEFKYVYCSFCRFSPYIEKDKLKCVDIKLKKFGCEDSVWS